MNNRILLILTAAAALAGCGGTTAALPAGGKPLGQGWVLSTDVPGVRYQVAALNVQDPARAAPGVFGAVPTGPQEHLIGVEYRITAVAGSVNEDASECAAVLGSDEQVYPALNQQADAITAGTDFDNGKVRLSQGRSGAGWVAFQVPDGVKVTSVLWTPNDGSDGDQTAPWSVP
jgi:hypothetical protein